jgi:uncharacterized coiled-coil protein SlyX
VSGGLEWGTVAQWLGGSASLFAVIISVKAMMSRPHEEKLEAINTKLSDIDERIRAEDARLFERLDGLESRLARVEVEIDHLPSKERLHELDKNVARLTSKLDVLVTVFDRLQHYLLSEGSK